ncbi:MAG: C40 family peptidase, partial [Crocinitomicaceae bacterium]|nr:C40 family peptidase [Crocinitomicaceae bacterium]
MRLTFILLFIILGSQSQARDLPEHELRDSIVCFASDHLGIPYYYGGTTTAGFDCTGFVYFVFKHFGITASRASSGYENAGEPVEKECAQPGDVILFTGT